LAEPSAGSIADREEAQGTLRHPEAANLSREQSTACPGVDAGERADQLCSRSTYLHTQPYLSEHLWHPSHRGNDWAKISRN
jgi:hypothetical protein